MGPHVSQATQFGAPRRASRVRLGRQHTAARRMPPPRCERAGLVVCGSAVLTDHSIGAGFCRDVFIILGHHTMNNVQVPQKKREEEEKKKEFFFFFFSFFFFFFFFFRCTSGLLLSSSSSQDPPSVG